MDGPQWAGRKNSAGITAQVGPGIIIKGVAHVWLVLLVTENRTYHFQGEDSQDMET